MIGTVSPSAGRAGAIFRNETPRIIASPIGTIANVYHSESVTVSDTTTGTTM